MRKVTERAARAFIEGRAMSEGNTAVTVQETSVATYTSLFLHGNEIAVMTGDKVTISLCGWPTSTTRERLHGLLQQMFAFGLLSERVILRQSKGRQLLTIGNIEREIGEHEAILLDVAHLAAA